MSDSSEIIVKPPTIVDYDGWLTLWLDYLTFYKTDLNVEVTEHLWQRIRLGQGVFGLLAFTPEMEGPVGLLHYVPHPNTWSDQTDVYLEDLFTAENARGLGVGRALIQELTGLGKRFGWRRIYWHTHENNHIARKLYDKVGTLSNFVRYDISLTG